MPFRSTEPDGEEQRDLAIALLRDQAGATDVILDFWCRLHPFPWEHNLPENIAGPKPCIDSSPSRNRPLEARSDAERWISQGRRLDVQLRLAGLQGREFPAVPLQCRESFQRRAIARA